MSTLTTTYSLIKPGVNDPTDQDLWGGYLNTDLDSLDTLIKTATDHVKRDITTTDTVLITDSNKMLLCDATSASFVESLLASATAGDGFSVIIVKTDSTANTVTIDADGSETISGALTYVLSNEGDAVMLSCDGSNWFITASTATSPDASETVKGIAEIATQAEVDGGVDSTRIITSDKLDGHVVQSVTTEYATDTTLSSAIPLDSSIPQNTEGAELFTVTITPKKTTNILRIKGNFFADHQTASSAVFAIFQDSTADAIVAGATGNTGGSTTAWGFVSLEKDVVAGTTSAITFKVRGGKAGNSTGSINPYFGSAGISSIRVEEIQA